MPMSRRSFLLAVAFLFLLLGSTAGVILGMLRYEQAWYAEAAVPPGPKRAQLSEDVKREIFNLKARLEDSSKPWGARLTAEQINSFFEEDFIRSGLMRSLLPENVSQPRIAIEPDRVHFAFRYGSGTWSTLISIDLCVYLIQGEATTLAIELEGFHAGALPISAQSLLEHISESEVWQQNGIEVVWYRHPDNGHPVAVLRFQAYQHTPIQLDALQLEKGAIAIQGRSSDLATLRTMLSSNFRILVQ
jgi:hypothetical protein